MKPQMTFEDGRRLAIDMLVRMSQTFGKPYSQETYGWHTGEIREAWRTARKSPDVEAGFLEVLTDVVGRALSGEPVNLKEYEKG